MAAADRGPADALLISFKALDRAQHTIEDFVQVYSAQQQVVSPLCDCRNLPLPFCVAFVPTSLVSVPLVFTRRRTSHCTAWTHSRCASG